MFKKLFLMGAAVALVLAGASAAQAAGISNTAHDLAATGGACAACHLPHGAQGARLWIAAPVSFTNVHGDVAPLCAYCHHEQGSQKGFGTDATSTTWVFGDSSHGHMISTATVPRSTVWSELPYHKTGMTLGEIECTTCHDVHNNDAGRNPFLRKTMGVLCATCHGNRQWNGTAWQAGNVATIGTLVNWNTSAKTDEGIANPGSHPVGLDVTGDGITDVPVTIWRSMAVGFAASRMKWSLGGHLSAGNTGGVTCATCHAVHGVKADIATSGGGTAANANPADNTAPNFNMLAVYQAANMQDGGVRSIANGHGPTAGAPGRNGLCEACHVGPLAAAYQVAGVGTGSAHIAPNPGATSYGHPVDGMRIQADWVANGTVWPTSNLNWPVGYSSATSASNPNVICESCHVAHPAANSGRVDLATAPAQAYTNEYILRTRAQDVCDACHRSSLKRHHPVGKTYNTAGVTYLISVNDTAGAYSLECGTCHGGTGAHNWPGRGQVGLDAGWRPTNNGRYGNQTAEMFNTVASLTCIDCHTGMLGAAKGNRSPTLHAVLSTVYSGGATNEAYNTIGYASHALGRMQASATAGNRIRLNKATSAAYWGSLNARLPGTNLFTVGTVWPATYFEGQGGWSVFGGDAANPVLVCESCHELQPTRNASTHLLLGYYIEESTAALAESRSAFCEGCHNPSGTHQMTGQTVTKTNAVLSTAIDTVNRPWLVTPADTVNVKLSNNNFLNCDTCHQPHDAATNSGTFILDVANASVGTGNAWLTGAGSAQYGSYSGYWPTIQNAKGGDHSRFCKQCHQY